jgi:hypothetical protein
VLNYNNKANKKHDESKSDKDLSHLSWLAVGEKSKAFIGDLSFKPAAKILIFFRIQQLSRQVVITRSAADGCAIPNDWLLIHTKGGIYVKEEGQQRHLSSCLLVVSSFRFEKKETSSSSFRAQRKCHGTARRPRQLQFGIK